MIIEQNREMTKRQVNSMFICLLCIFPILNVLMKSINVTKDVLFHKQIIYFLNILSNILQYLSYLSYAVVLITIVIVLKRNHIEKGFKYAFKHYFAVLKIRKMFLDSKYFVNRFYFGREISEPLKVDLKFLENRQAILKVQNHIKFDTKLDGAALGSALGNYIVENDYISKDNNFYIYELLDATVMNLQSELKTFEEYKEFVSDVNDYALKIDERLTLKYGHFLIVGRTGSGKTYALYHLLLQSYLKQIKPKFYFCDPKGSSLMVVGKILSKETTALSTEDNASNFNAIKNEIEKVYNIMLERQKELEPKLDKIRLDADYSDFEMTPIILIIDEMGALSKMLQAETKKQEPRDIYGMLNTIIFMGRQLGVFVWIIMQQANAKALPTEIRDSMMFRTVLGNSERTTYETAFDVSQASDVPNFKFGSGTGVYRYDGSEKTKLSLLAFPYLNFDLLKTFREIKENL